MSKGIEKPSFIELLKDLDAICEVNERVNTIDLIRLKELVIQLDKMLFDKFKTINNNLIANHNSKYLQYKDIEYWKNNLLQYGYSYNGLVNLKMFIQNRINYLTEKQTSTFNDLIFKDSPSQRFFIYLVDNWLKNEVHKRTALSYIFTQMCIKTKESITTYKIKSTQVDFALEYWNVEYKYLIDLPKKPRFTKGNFTDYYINRFERHLNEFEEV